MKRRQFLQSITLGLSSLRASDVFAGSRAPRPNFVFILIDDQSWNGLSIPMSRHLAASSTPFLDTPGIAGLAAQGMRFSEAYAPSPHCAPTRISLQTGKTPARLHWTKNGPSRSGREVDIPPGSKTMKPSELTLAERLKASGYRTAHFGKWGLRNGGPEAHGYDESDGDTGTRNAGAFLPPNPADIFGITKRAIRFMERAQQDRQPFFIQLSHYAVHWAKNPRPATVEKYRARLGKQPEELILSAAITEDLDTGIHQLLHAMQTMGVLNDTYVFYTSDNGGNNGVGAESPLRGGKGSLLEGGIRVPFIVRGPGIPANTFSDEPICGYDLFPTILSLAFDESPSWNLGKDGGDLSHLLTGVPGPVLRPDQGLLFHFPHYYKNETPQSALRIRNLKLLKYYTDDRLLLFDIARDPGEKHDLSSRDPGLAGALHDLLYRRLEMANAFLPQT